MYPSNPNRKKYKQRPIQCNPLEPRISQFINIKIYLICLLIEVLQKTWEQTGHLAYRLLFFPSGMKFPSCFILICLVRLLECTNTSRQYVHFFGSFSCSPSLCQSKSLCVLNTFHSLLVHQPFNILLQLFDTCNTAQMFPSVLQIKLTVLIFEVCIGNLRKNCVTESFKDSARIFS